MKNKYKILLSGILLAFSVNIYAQNYPEGISLSDLNSYVNVKKDCVNMSCNSINKIELMNTNWNDKTLKIKLYTTARTISLLELPFNIQQININSIKINDKPWYGAEKNNDKYYVTVPEGINNIELILSLKENVSILSLYNNPKNFENSDLNNPAKLIKRNNDYFIELTNTNKATNSENKSESIQLPSNPFFILKRNLVLSDKWKMVTTLTPLPGLEINKAINIQIPLLKGEHILNEDINVVDGKINVLANNNIIQWESILDETKEVSIEGSKNQPFVESFNLISEKNWFYNFKGLNPNTQQGAEYGWLLLPSDILNLSFEKPEVLKGENLNINKLKINANYSKQPFVYETSFNINSSLGGRTYVTIPEEYKAQNILINNRSVQTTEKRIALDLISGENNIKLDLLYPQELSVMTKFPKLKFEKEIVNIEYNANISDTDRWIIWTGGANLNTAILLWGVLISLIIFAYVLSYFKTPLSMLSWTLLLFGLSQSSLWSILIVVATLLLLKRKIDYFKEKDMSLKVNENNYNHLQIVLFIGLTLSIIFILNTLRQGLLYHPEIFSNNSLEWYTEQSETANVAYFISLPMWWYHLLMFVWAAWFAFSLVKWSKWIWSSLTLHSLWIKETPVDEVNTIDLESKE